MNRKLLQQNSRNMKSKLLKQIPGLYVSKTSRELQCVLSGVAVYSGRDVTTDNVLPLYAYVLQNRRLYCS